MVKTMVVETFHFFNFSTKLVSRGMVLGDVLVTFGDLEGIYPGWLAWWLGRDRGRDRDRISRSGPDPENPPRGG